MSKPCSYPDNTRSMELKQRIHALPQELFDAIYQLTFTATPAVHIVDRSYKFPHLLAVDPASRELFARSYYGSGSTFFTDQHAVFYRWVRTLTAQHRHLLHDVRTQFDYQVFRNSIGSTMFSDPELMNERDRLHFAQWLRASDRKNFAVYYPDVRFECVHVGVKFLEDDGHGDVVWSDDVLPAKGESGGE